jgi:hypothetical protein
MARPRNPAPATTEAELEALLQDYEERGPAAIATIREADPDAFMRLMLATIEMDGGFDD